MKCLTPITIKNKNECKIGVGAYRYVKVPCGKCYACLRNKQNMWVCRCVMEIMSSKSTFIFVLTYDDEHLPSDFKVRKSDVQKFLKRFRKNFACRYFIAAEYGSKSGRPHYHCLLFFHHYIGNLTMVLKGIEKAWSNGIVYFMTVSLASINYSLKYCTKQALMSDKMWMLSSRKPGIGALCCRDDVLKFYDESTGTLCINGNRYLLPRYLRLHFNIPQDMEALRQFYFEDHTYDEFTDEESKEIDFFTVKSVIRHRDLMLQTIKDKT